jgi:hypothetical protein
MKMAVFWDAAQCHLIEIYRRFSVFAAWSIALMKETVCNSETSTSFHQTTWRNIPEDNIIMHEAVRM